MRTGFIQVNLYKYKELKETTQKNIRLRLLSYFKNYVNDDTLFLSDGTFFTIDGLNFKGLRDAKLIDVDSKIITRILLS